MLKKSSVGEEALEILAAGKHWKKFNRVGRVDAKAVAMFRNLAFYLRIRTVKLGATFLSKRVGGASPIYCSKVFGATTDQAVMSR